MNIGLISVLGFKMAIFCPSDTLDNVVVSASRQAISKQQVVYPIHQKKIMEGASMNSPRQVCLFSERIREVVQHLFVA
jgi:hypothetical protein